MDLRVAPVGEGELEGILPLIAGYQRFYEAQPDDERNRSFFRRFLSPSEEGLLLGAWADGVPVGFATLYWTHSSTRATDIALLNDLYVSEEVRAAGVGMALMEAAMAATRERGLPVVEWYTHVDNRRAQRLYERIFGAERSAWFGYDVEVGPPSP